MYKNKKVELFFSILPFIYFMAMCVWMTYSGFKFLYSQFITTTIFFYILPVICCILSYILCYHRVMEILNKPKTFKSIFKSIELGNYITDFIVIALCINISAIDFWYNYINIIKSFMIVLISISIGYKIINQYELSEKLNK